jgi:hypothetical protein
VAVIAAGVSGLLALAVLLGAGLDLGRELTGAGKVVSPEASKTPAILGGSRLWAVRHAGRRA